MYLLRLSLACVWLLTAVASWLYPQAQSLALLQAVELEGAQALFALYSGIMLDALMGVLTLLNPRTLQPWLWLTQAAVIIVYSLIIILYLPDYALHPFGILIKNIPLLIILWLLWQDVKSNKEDKHV
jgi:hypothetical protein